VSGCGGSSSSSAIPTGPWRSGPLVRGGRGCATSVAGAGSNVILGLRAHARHPDRRPAAAAHRGRRWASSPSACASTTTSRCAGRGRPRPRPRRCRQVALQPEIVLQVFLPILLFEATLATDLRRLRETSSRRGAGGAGHAHDGRGVRPDPARRPRARLGRACLLGAALAATGHHRRRSPASARCASRRGWPRSWRTRASSTTAPPSWPSPPSWPPSRWATSSPGAG
jgi:hypothetical protein